MKQKVKYTVRLDAETCKKAAAVAEYEGLTLNNFILKQLRAGIDYHERVHGHFDKNKLSLPEDAEIEQ